MPLLPVHSLRGGTMGMLLAASTIAVSGCDHDVTSPQGPYQESVVLRWDQLELTAIRDTHPGPPMVARDLAVVHTAMFDAWAAYDARAVGTRLGGSLRRPAPERTKENKEKAISF